VARNKVLVARFGVRRNWLFFSVRIRRFVSSICKCIAEWMDCSPSIAVIWRLKAGALGD